MGGGYLLLKWSKLSKLLELVELVENCLFDYHPLSTLPHSLPLLSFSATETYL